RSTARISTGLQPMNARTRSRRWNRARPSSAISTPNHSSRRCCTSPWRASSPIRSTAVTATKSHGRWVASPDWRRSIPTRSSNIATSATSSSRNRSRISREGRREMATRLKEVDAVMVGMGWTGSILARELTKAGLTVVGLERGEDLTPRENFALPAVRDELRYSYRLELIQDPALETVTFRHRPSESPLPMRRFGSFLPGNSVGGAANHWGGQHWRYLPSDHLTRSHIVERYGAKAIPDD